VLTGPAPEQHEVIRMTSIDQLDAALLTALDTNPRAGIRELSTRLGVARNTVQARLRRAQEAGVLEGFSARINLSAIGMPVHAFVRMELAQGALRSVVEELRSRPAVLEVHATTGRSDLFVRVASPDHPELQELLHDLLAIPGVLRTDTEMALTTPVPFRVGPLLRSLTTGAGRGRAGTSPHEPPVGQASG
jgi:DNA-binding Lrp family transcriptional regulator